VDESARDKIPGYRNYRDLHTAAPPRWSKRSKLWEKALDLVSADSPPGTSCFIHRDYHPENTLWSRGRLTGVVDWTSGSWGPAAVDTAHMRWNLAVTYGLDAADRFWEHHKSIGSEISEDQSYWDLVTVLDLVVDPDPGGWSEFDLERLERYVESVVAGRRDKR
jgi:aminoglycoside phosphotransferase (APT) family kinase protein